MIFPQNTEEYILTLCFFVVLCLCFLIWRLHSRKIRNDPRKQFTMQTLATAREQAGEFNLKPSDGTGWQGLKATLHSLDQRAIGLEARDEVPKNLAGQTVEAFFRISAASGMEFYKFTSKVHKITQDGACRYIFLDIPPFLQSEQKRHFERVTPAPDSVGALAVWELDPNRPLPPTTTEIGSPLVHYKKGMTSVPVRIENISGSGIALRFSAGSSDKIRLGRGSQIIGLILYSDGQEDKNMSFLFTAEAMNARREDDDSSVLGFEFTNLASLEHGSSEIRWRHSSPSKGEKPILQWISQEKGRQKKG